MVATIACQPLAASPSQRPIRNQVVGGVLGRTERYGWLVSAGRDVALDGGLVDLFDGAAATLSESSHGGFELFVDSRASDKSLLTKTKPPR
jgi:hypothetical protein